jgi:hypothetical protein
MPWLLFPALRSPKCQLSPCCPCASEWPFQPRTQHKAVELPKKPRAYDSRKQSQQKQSPSGQHHDFVYGKGEGVHSNPKQSCKNLDMGISDNISVKPVGKLKKKTVGRSRHIPSSISYGHTPVECNRFTHTHP